MKNTFLLLFISLNSFAQSTNPAPYCTAPSNTAVNGGIIEVNFATIDNISGVTPPYTYYSNIPAPVLVKGRGYPIAITFDPIAGDNSWGAVSFDFNHTGSSFDDAFDVNCTPYLITGINSSQYYRPVTFWATIDIPVSAVSGVGRMRVVRFGSASPVSPFICGSCNPVIGTIGETEDYNIIIEDNDPASVPVITGKQFSFYPNPSKDIINIVAPNNSRVSITNTSGMELYQGIDAKINISTFPAGLYFVRINNEVSKLIKE